MEKAQVFSLAFSIFIVFFRKNVLVKQPFRFFCLLPLP